MDCVSRSVFNRIRASSRVGISLIRKGYTGGRAAWPGQVGGLRTRFLVLQTPRPDQKGSHEFTREPVESVRLPRSASQGSAKAGPRQSGRLGSATRWREGEDPAADQFGAGSGGTGKEVHTASVTAASPVPVRGNSPTGRGRVARGQGSRRPQADETRRDSTRVGLGFDAGAIATARADDRDVSALNRRQDGHSLAARARAGVRTRIVFQGFNGQGRQKSA